MQTAKQPDGPELDSVIFQAALDRFRSLIEYNANGHRVTNFREGHAAAEESYKPRLREHALSLLNFTSWSADAIGLGEILERTIAAIEINEQRKAPRNNLVFWQNLGISPDNLEVAEEICARSDSVGGGRTCIVSRL